MERRSFLRLSVLGTAGMAIPLAYGCGVSAIDPVMAQPPQLSHIVDKKTMEEIGRAYLKQHAEENDDRKLAQMLALPAGIAGTDAVHAYFDKQIQHDFDTGNVALASGWVLSVTEARQCALQSLLSAHNRS